MARNSKQGRRPDPRSTAAGARRLGGQQNATMSASAQRRYDRRHQARSRQAGWIAVGTVVVVVVALLVWNFAKGNSGPGSSSGISTGQHPALAAATQLDPVLNVPLATYNSVGISNQPAPFTLTKDQPALTSDGKPRFVYYGAEYCPYCGVMRWSMIAALSRFGTFSGLKQTTSSSTDIPSSVPTFSFLGATYSSPYVAFTPYEYLDRDKNPLQSVPKQVNDLYAKYDGSASGKAAAPFNPSSSAGIPFLDIGNKYVSSGDPQALAAIAQALSGGGPGAAEVASSLTDPTSGIGPGIGAKYFISEANYLSAAICALDGGKPASVCSTSGVKAAAAALAKQKPVG
ncbi:MAG TPA: DUF929 family protein [Acidimicrobiales bacterium]|nr:DUF929 family protein [Acidimicrobiales bacterium]